MDNLTQFTDWYVNQGVLFLPKIFSVAIYTYFLTEFIFRSTTKNKKAKAIPNFLSFQ